MKVISPSFWPKKTTVLSVQLLTGIFLSYSWLCPILALHNLLTPYRVSFPISNFNYLWWNLSHLTSFCWRHKGVIPFLYAANFLCIWWPYFLFHQMFSFLPKEQFASLSIRMLTCKENQYWCHEQKALIMSYLLTSMRV